MNARISNFAAYADLLAEYQRAAASRTTRTRRESNRSSLLCVGHHEICVSCKALMSEAKPAQVLQLEPAKELVFQGPFTDIVNAHLQLKNPTERPVCFKVKTTAPKQYCVRPNSGVLPPSSSKTITVMLQPMDGVPTDVARHKFMVQTCFCPPGDVDLDNIWKTISPNELMYSKLMVVFQQRTSEHGGAVREEVPSAVAFNTPQNAGNNRASASPGGNRVSELEEKLKSETDLRLKSEKERAILQHDLDELFSKHAKLQQAMQSPEGGTPTIQVILLAIAALLVGLIVGKLF